MHQWSGPRCVCTYQHKILVDVLEMFGNTLAARDARAPLRRCEHGQVFLSARGVRARTCSPEVATMRLNSLFVVIKLRRKISTSNVHLLTSHIIYRRSFSAADCFALRLLRAVAEYSHRAEQSYPDPLERAARLRKTYRTRFQKNREVLPFEQ